MVDQRIVSFIRQNLQQGYDINTIRSHLLQSGFSEGAVNDAVNSVYNVTEVKHVHHLSPLLLIVLAVIGIGLVITGVVLYKSEPATKKLLDVGIESVPSSVEAGKDVVFIAKITNFGSKGRYDITMRYDLLDSKQKPVTSKEETIAVETSASPTVRINVPERVNPGSYIVRVQAKYEGKLATASQSIKVILGGQKESCYDGIMNQDEKGIDCGGKCPNLNCCNNGFMDLGEEGKDCGGPCNPCKNACDTCNDNNPCTEDVCGQANNFICMHNTLTPCCGNGVCEENEDCQSDCPKSGENPFEGLSQGAILDRIKGIMSSDPKLAESYCGKYLTSSYKDQCYVELAVDQRSDSYCRNAAEERVRDGCYVEISKLLVSYEPCRKITNDIKRDSCYFNYGTATNDFSVCDVILNEELKRSCDTLKQIQQIQAVST